MIELEMMIFSWTLDLDMKFLLEMCISWDQASLVKLDVFFAPSIYIFFIHSMVGAVPNMDITVICIVGFNQSARRVWAHLLKRKTRHKTHVKFQVMPIPSSKYLHCFENNDMCIWSNNQSYLNMSCTYLPFSSWREDSRLAPPPSVNGNCSERGRTPEMRVDGIENYWSEYIGQIEAYDFEYRTYSWFACTQGLFQRIVFLVTKIVPCLCKSQKWPQLTRSDPNSLGNFWPLWTVYIWFKRMCRNLVIYDYPNITPNKMNFSMSRRYKFYIDYKREYKTLG